MESRDPDRVHESQRIIISKRRKEERERKGKRAGEAEKGKKSERNDGIA